jgi:signal transduction histidine kinase/CHASE2 domain-containing sensor protein
MKRLVAVFAVCALAAAAVLLVSYTIPFKLLNFNAYDFTMKVAGSVPPAAPITIVTIDEESLQKKGKWQWPRKRIADLVNGIAQGKPRVLALDIMLDDEETETTDGDAALARALAAHSSVVLPVRIVTDSGGFRWRRPQAQFIQSNVRLGHVHTEPELDGINRSIFTDKAAEGGLLPAFSLEVLRAANVAIDPLLEPQAGDGFTRVRQATTQIRFAGETGKTFEQIPAWKILDGIGNVSALRDRIVLVGVTAEGLQEDQWFTPFSVEGLKTPGVEIHANAIDTYYARRWIRDVPADILYVSLLAILLLLVWLNRRFEGVRFYAAAVLLIPLLPLVSVLLMKNWNIWLPFPTLLAGVVSGVTALQVLRIVQVNSNLDSKIEKLSPNTSTVDRVSLPVWKPSDQVELTAPAGAAREAWLDSIRLYEAASTRRQNERSHILGVRWRNSKWRLEAVDFFNDELVRFLEFNSAVLGSIEDVTIVSDVLGRTVYQNPAARGLDGFSEDPPFAPEYVSQLLDGRNVVEEFAQVFGEGKTVSLHFVPGRGARRFYNATLSPIGKTAVVLTLHDATAQHELNLAKNEMVSLVSHELRTPLTAIRGYSDMLLKYDLVHDKGRKFLGTIVEESDRLGKLIQSFLDIAYIESGRQKVSMTDLEIAPMLRDLQSILDPLAATKGIQLRMDSEAGARVHADRTLLYQALTNLVTNAIKYSPDGTMVQVGVSNGNGRVVFQVADQGYGIPLEDTGRIFDKFYRRSNQETIEQSGFGLGLAFVKEVALRHGGEVTVESEVGKGSRFSLKIPS